MNKRSPSAKPKSLNRQLLGRIKLGVKPKLQWDATYQLMNNSDNSLPKKSQVLEFFKTPSTPEDVWHNLPLELQNLEEFTNILKKGIAQRLLKEDLQLPNFDQPIFIVSTPRAGSTLLFEILSQFPELWTVGRESHDIMEAIPEVHPAFKNYSSNRLTEADALPHVNLALRDGFVRQLRDRAKAAYLNLQVKQRPHKIRFLEKTPKNALRIPFLKAIFPDALFIFLYREPKGNISSMIEGWQTKRFIAHAQPPGWQKKNWSFLLIPGWQSLQNCSIAEITAHQWKITNSCIWNDLQYLPSSSWCLLRYQDLVEEPKKVVREISKFAGLSWDAQIEKKLSQSLPNSAETISQPSPNKWLQHERQILEILPIVEPIANLMEGKLNECSIAQR